jgi:hypothetical protein
MYSFTLAITIFVTLSSVSYAADGIKVAKASPTPKRTEPYVYKKSESAKPGIVAGSSIETGGDVNNIPNSAESSASQSFLSFIFSSIWSLIAWSITVCGFILFSVTALQEFYYYADAESYRKLVGNNKHFNPIRRKLVFVFSILLWYYRRISASLIGIWDNLSGFFFIFLISSLATYFLTDKLLPVLAVKFGQKSNIA